MFEEWGFLLTEIWVLLALAALVGLIAGWIIWGRASDGSFESVEAARLRTELDACKRKNADKNARIAALEAKPVPAGAADAVAAPVAAAISDPAPSGADEIVEGAKEGTRPAALNEPRDGMADDLRKIKGVGPKMEKLCNSLGFYHFDQIAAWTPDEVAWVDANLEGFKGRVTRDDWVAQAKLLAIGGQTDFSTRVDKGDVY